MKRKKSKYKTPKTLDSLRRQETVKSPTILKRKLTS